MKSPNQLYARPDASQGRPVFLIRRDSYSEYSDDDEDDDSDYDEDSDYESEEEDDEPVLGPLQRLSKSLKEKRQDMLAKRRHPVLEWKEVARWHSENEAGWAAAEEEQRRHERIAAEKAARRERKVKRKAQRKLTKQKETEFRILLEEYTVAIAKSEKRTALLTQFSKENRSAQLQKLAALDAARRADQLREAAERIEQAEKHDEEQAKATADKLQQSIDSSNEIGRRFGVLPAINAPAALPTEEQDETSTVLMLRVSQEESVAGSTDIASGFAVPTGKRQFFTVNLKRCKHVEELRGERIGDRGAKELARSLLTGACPRVRRIYLGWNLVKYPGIAALADCFTRGACTQLYELDLRCNNVDNKALISLLTALEKGAVPELVDISLQGNLLGDEGARSLAHAFFRGTLRELRNVDIRQNRIRNDGMQALWNVFTAPNFRRFCPKLQLLDMRRNDAHGALTRSFCPCPPYLQF
ncbi:leucine Rich Repeat [Phytophthora boehmeriae]|uniref:Leucine Rich Repeat n=1 Tax=Phytophthora boehmeriae TaxID=109152 RepID=A0A8T1WQB9_9STRA|nr:leucine Rich Repeat [Phytophthora boehmeriae]